VKQGLQQHGVLRQDLRINPRLYQAMDLLYMPLLDLQQHRIGIAVDPYFPDFLKVTGFFAFAPQPLARSGEIDRFLALCSLLQRLAIHPRHGEHAPAARLLRNRRHQSVRCPLHFV